MAGDLRQQRPGHALNGKGEGGVLRGAGVAEVGEHTQKLRALLRRQALHELIHTHRGIAQLRGGGHDTLRLRRVGDQIDFQHCNILLIHL